MYRFYITCIIILFSLPATAQKAGPNSCVDVGRNELSAGYGMLTSTGFLEKSGKAVNGFFSKIYSATVYHTQSLMGGIFITAKRSTRNRKFRFGLTAGYDGATGTFTNPVNNTRGNYSSRYITIAGEASVNYLYWKSLRVYASIGVGYTLLKHYITTNTVTGLHQKEVKRNTMPNILLVPTGISYGKTFGGFIEAGFGYKGILQAGMYLKL